MPAPNAIWWRAFDDAVGRLVDDGMMDRKEIDRIATGEADDVLDNVCGSEQECAE